MKKLMEKKDVSQEEKRKRLRNTDDIAEETEDGGRY